VVKLVSDGKRIILFVLDPPLRWVRVSNDIDCLHGLSRASCRHFLLYTTENTLPIDNVSMSIGHLDRVLGPSRKNHW